MTTFDRLMQDPKFKDEFEKRVIDKFVKNLKKDIMNF